MESKSEVGSSGKRGSVRSGSARSGSGCAPGGAGGSSRSSKEDGPFVCLSSIV
jgi:hypothetical protein